MKMIYLTLNLIFTTIIYLFSANPYSHLQLRRNVLSLDPGNLHALYILIITSSILPIRSVHDHTIQAFVSVLALMFSLAEPL
jgi:hypothetical protein